MDDIWRDALLYNKWANLGVLDGCESVGDDQLELTVPGTYGTIKATLIHMLAGEQRYVRRLTGAAPALKEEAVFPGIAALREHARRSGDALVAAAAALEPDATTQADYDGTMVTLRKSLVVVQAIHHGNDHRAQIGTILGAHSLPVPEVDVWAYGLTVRC